MADKLIIENFGPIKKAEIDVKDMLVFIGPQSSGKSTLAKLITILNDFNFQQNSNQSFEKELYNYNLSSFLSSKTKISYKAPFFDFRYSNGKIDKFHYEETLNYFSKDKNLKPTKLVLGLMIASIIMDGKIDVILREIQFDENFGINSELVKILKDKYRIPELVSEILKSYNRKINREEILNLSKPIKKVFAFIRPLDSMYIPSERSLLPLIINNFAGLINNKVSFPQYILQALQEYEKGLNKIENIDLNIIGENLRFKRKNNESFIYHNLNQKVYLKEASSGVQSILPILLLVETAKLNENHINLNFVVEEPELNLYPEAQYGLIKYLVKNCLETDNKVKTKNLIITTHSPYILASINNLLFAHSKGSNSKKVKDIVYADSWICPKNFNAYQVIDGGVERIFNKKEGLIEDTIIDESSELIMEDFRKIAAIN